MAVACQTGPSPFSRESEISEDTAPYGSSAPAAFHPVPESRLAGPANVDALAAVVGSMETATSWQTQQHRRLVSPTLDASKALRKLLLPLFYSCTPL